MRVIYRVEWVVRSRSPHAFCSISSIHDLKGRISRLGSLVTCEGRAYRTFEQKKEKKKIYQG